MPVLSPVNESPEKCTIPNKSHLNNNRPPLIHTDGPSGGNLDDKQKSQSLKRNESESSSFLQAQTPKHSNKNAPGSIVNRPGAGVHPFQPHPSYHPHPSTHFGRPSNYLPHMHPYGGAPPPYGGIPSMSSPYGHSHLPQSALISPGGSSALRSTNSWTGRPEHTRYPSGEYDNHPHPPPYPPQQGGGASYSMSGEQGYGGHSTSYPYGRSDGNTGQLNRLSSQESLNQSQSPMTAQQDEQGFVRAVSASFGNHSRMNQSAGSNREKVSPFQRDIGDDMSLHSTADSDRSWKQLNQVASIEEERLRREEEMETASLASIGTQKSFQDKLTPSKLSSLNSLSSVASIQEPIDTSGTKGGNSLDFSGPDLLQCASGSSGSLLFNGQDELLTKRSREERGDIDMGRGDCDDEIRGAASSSSPPNVAELSMKEKDESRPMKKRRSNSNFDDYDQVPNYTFSIDSVPSFSNKDGDKIGNESSRSLTPLQSLDKAEGKLKSDVDGERTLRSSMPSWDLPGTVSFGDALTVSSHKSAQVSQSMLSSSFSFDNNDTKDKKLCKSTSSNGKNTGLAPGLPETRNQSFEYQNREEIVPTRTESSDMSYQGVPRQIYSHPPNGRSRSGFPPNIPPWGHGVRDQPEGGKHQMPPHRHPGPMPGPYLSAQTGSFGSTASPHVPLRPPHLARNFSQDHTRSENSTPTGSIGLQRGYHPLHHGSFGGPPPTHGGSEQHLPHAFRPPPPNLSGHPRHMNRHQPPSVYLMATSPASRPGIHRSVSNLSKSGPGGVYCWTKDDDARLTEIMKKYKNPKDWEPIAKEFGGNKSSKEIHERWIRYLKPGVRKGQWQDHEDAIVVEAVTTSTEQPFTRWSDLAQRLPGRVGKQIRDRWVNHLNPNINHMPFSREDDLMLWDGHKQLGKRWVEISTKLFQSSRSENHIKNRWYSASFKKFVATEFGPDAYTDGKKKTPRAPKSE